MKGQVTLFTLIGIAFLITGAIILAVFVIPTVYDRVTTDPETVFVNDCYDDISACYLYHHGLERLDGNYINQKISLCVDESYRDPGIDIRRNVAETGFHAGLRQGESAQLYYAEHPVRLRYIENFPVGSEMHLNSLRAFDGGVRLYQYS